VSLPSNAHLIWHPFIGYCQHDSMFPTPPGTFPRFPHIDFDVVNGLFIMSLPTAIPGQSISHGEILDWNVSMEGQMADAGLILPHVSIPPVPFNAMLPIIIFFGSSKILMGSGQTIIRTKSAVFQSESNVPAGCCLFPYIPLSLNLQCWDPIPLPTDVVVAPNTVQVGINGADYLDAFIKFVIEVIIALAVNGLGKAYKKVMKKPPAKPMEEGIEMAVIDTSRQAAKEASEEAAEEAAEAVAEKAIKQETKGAGKRIAGALAENKGSIALKIAWKGGIKPFLADPAKDWLMGKIFPPHGPEPKHGYAPQSSSPEPPSPRAAQSGSPPPEPSPDHRFMVAGLGITQAEPGEPPDPELKVDNEVFDKLPGRLRTAYLLGYAAEVFGTETVRMLYESISPLVSDICGHGDDKNPEENYWGGKWQVFRAE
jgi:hypothetical protein